MKQLVTLLVGLMLAVPMYGQTERGFVDHIETHGAYDCNANRAGHRIWCMDSALHGAEQEETCDGGTTWTATGPGVGGTVTDVFACDGSVTPDCNTIDAKASSALDFTADVGSGPVLEADDDSIELRVPWDASSGGCVTAVTGKGGAICKSGNTNNVYIGEVAVGDGGLMGGTWRDIGGSISEVFECDNPPTGTCLNIDVEDNQSLDFSFIDLTDSVEGLTLPGDDTDCSSWTATEADGQVCWQRDTDELWVGTGATAVLVGPDAGDIESVFDCASGDCNDIDAKASSVLDFTAGDTLDADVSSIELILPFSADCDTAVDDTNASICVSEAFAGDEKIYVGRDLTYGFGPDRLQDVSGDIRGVYDCYDASHQTGAGLEDITGFEYISTDSCRDLTLPDGAVLQLWGNPECDFSPVDGDTCLPMEIDNNTEGLLLPGLLDSYTRPQYGGSDIYCSNWVGGGPEGSGQVCWDHDLRELWIGSGDTGNITATADDGTGDARFTSAGHGLTNGTRIDIYLTAGKYDDEWVVEDVTTDTFDIDEPINGHDDGFWTRHPNKIGDNIVSERTEYIRPEAMSLDGAQCTGNIDTTLGGPIVHATIDCLDHNDGRIRTEYVMPDNWDGGNISVRMDMVHADADPDGVFGGTVAIQCRGDSEVLDNTWGTAAISFDWSPAGYVTNDTAHMEAALTPDDGAGASLDPGDVCFIEFRGVAATITDTNPDNIHILGMTVGYTVDDLDEVD